MKEEMLKMENQHKEMMNRLEEERNDLKKEKEEFVLKNCESCAKIEELEESLFSFSETVKNQKE